MGKRKIISIDSPKWAGEDYLREFEKQYEIHVVIPGDRMTTVARFAEKVKAEGQFDAVAILMGTGPYHPFDEELLRPVVPNCQILASASAGYNEFDVDWMARNGIVFTNSRNAVNEAAADMAILMMLSILRDVQRLRTSMANGTWRAGLAPTKDPSGLTLGIIGMGQIGKHIARKAKAFNMRIAYHQRGRLLPSDEDPLDAKFCASLDELLSTADVISVTCPLNENTRGLLSHEQFAKMKDGVFIINVSRGPVINENALIEALKTGKVSRAGLDVFDNEPNINPYFINNDRVIIQPHMGGITEVAWQRGYRETFENIRSYFDTGKAISPVNADGVQRCPKL